MKKILLGFANDETFLVSEATANKVKSVLPPNRFVTTTTIEDLSTLPSRLGGPAQSKSVFDQARRSQPGSTLTPRQQQLAERFAKYLTPPAKQSK